MPKWTYHSEENRAIETTCISSLELGDDQSMSISFKATKNICVRNAPDEIGRVGYRLCFADNDTRQEDADRWQPNFRRYNNGENSLNDEFEI